MEISFICLVGIFSDRETLELLAVSLSFEDLLPRLNIAWFCFICGTALLVFICNYRNVVESLNHVSFFWVNFSLFFHVWTATHILQFSSATVSHNFVWLSHNALSLTANLLVSFWFHTLPLFCVDCHTLFPLFLGEIVSRFFAWMSHKWPVCLHYLCVNVTHPRHFLNENSTCPSSFLSFGNITNLFITTFLISNVIIHLQ